MLTEKARESRLRRELLKDGYRLVKTPARSWRRENYGVGFMVIETSRNIAVIGQHPFVYSASLEDVEDWASG